MSELVDCRIGSIGPITHVINEFLAKSLDKFKALSEFLNYDFDDAWKTDLYPYQYYPVMGNDNDNAVYMLTTLYLLAVEVPLYITEDTVDVVRENFMCWLVSYGELPM